MFECGMALNQFSKGLSPQSGRGPLNQLYSVEGKCTEDPASLCAQCSSASLPVEVLGSCWGKAFMFNPTLWTVELRGDTDSGYHCFISPC